MSEPCSEAFWITPTGRESLGYCVEHPELAAWPCPWDDIRAERDALAARLAAVEALAEGPTGDGYQPYAVTIGTETHLAVLLDDLRAALATGTDR